MPSDGRRFFTGFLKNRQQQQPDLYPQRLVLPDHGYVPTLSPPQVTSLLTVNEAAVHNATAGHDSVYGFESNMLPSNHPIEDRRAVGRLPLSGGLLFGVYDGHAGAACAQAVSERLMDYIAVSLLPHDLLEKVSHGMKAKDALEFIQRYVFHNDYVSEELMALYRSSLYKYIVEMLSLGGMDEEEDSSIAHKLKSAFMRLDNDISHEAAPVGGVVNFDHLQVALSGSCATVAHIYEREINVATTGDVRAVLGYRDETGNWKAKPLSVDQNADNQSEADRVKSGHPMSEAGSVLKNNRLLGQLIPLRAFGDIRYKWNAKDLKHLGSLLDMVYAQNVVPPHYYTPPYLISEPQVMHHHLTSKDKFMVLASDGLWEMLSNDKVVTLVGQHLEGKLTKDRFRLEETPVRSLGNINQELVKRKSGLAQKSMDSNTATHLIRHALGYEHRKVSEMLTFPPLVSRYYRDDITVLVIYFDSEYLEG